MDVLEAIHKQAYEGGATGLPAPSLQGWMDGQNFLQFFDEAIRNAGRNNDHLVIEVGSWKGLSTCTMAAHLDALGCTAARVVAIDTWLGSPEHMRMAELGARELGVPTLYRQFLANVLAKGLHRYVYPFPISSVQGGHFLEQNGVEADVVYIDAGHEYEAVMLDIVVFWRLLRPGGSMLLDDYKWPGVRRAIDEFAESQGIVVRSQGNVAVLRKPGIAAPFVVL